MIFCVALMQVICTAPPRLELSLEVHAVNVVGEAEEEETVRVCEPSSHARIAAPVPLVSVTFANVQDVK